MILAAQILAHILNRHQGFFDFTRRAPHRENVRPAEDLHPVGIFKRAQVLVMLSEEQQRFLGAREMNFFSDHYGMSGCQSAGGILSFILG